jgi:FtsP/CotA-like multicopper oxidase with cupredoxin domain
MSKSTPVVANQAPLSDLRIPRRKFMIGAAAAGMTLGSALGRAYTQIVSSSDYSLRIAPLRLELAPGKVIDTFAYNDRVPGPVLRLREGRQISIDIRNDTDIDDIIHWHGLYVPSLADGAMEEGSPMVVRGGTQRYTFVPKPIGTRMNQPGVWIFGGIREEDRQMGLGVVVEYANQRGEPQWVAPPSSAWDYTVFGIDRPVAAPDERIELLFEKVAGGRGGYNRWTINGRSWPATNPLFTTAEGKRYRLFMTNKSGDNHPVHLHRHTFEVTKVGDKATAGVMKDTINMTRFSTVEIDFIADDPGPTLLHCHHQDHQDEGFMGLMTYII